jgi:hypothetical protein
MKTTSFLGAVLLLFACANGAVPRTADVAVGQEFTLAPGQTASVDGGALTVRFVGVAHDSRCPVNVQCIAAGNAVARLRLSDGGREVVELNTTVGAKEALHGGYTVHLVALRPEPTAGIRILYSTYRAVLRVTKG